MPINTLANRRNGLEKKPAPENSKGGVCQLHQTVPQAICLFHWTPRSIRRNSFGSQFKSKLEKILLSKEFDRLNKKNKSVTRTQCIEFSILEFFVVSCLIVLQ